MIWKTSSGIVYDSICQSTWPILSPKQKIMYTVPIVHKFHNHEPCLMCNNLLLVL
jgi:hypothetical protein